MSRSPADESVFHAVACPTRRAVLDALAAGEQNVGELVEKLDVTQSAVSQQLAVLKRARLVEERSEARFRYYRLRADPLSEIDAWMAGYRIHLERQLDARPQPGWRGFVECEVLEVREPSMIRYSWIGDDDGKNKTQVTWSLAPNGAGTRLTFEHTGFSGVGGFLLARLIMRPGWKAM